MAGCPDPTGRPEADAPADMLASLRAAGLVRAGVEPRVTSLTGGVASDIWKVEGGREPFVIKRALPKLRVAADWRAPVSRNLSEVGWFTVAGTIVPGNVPSIVFHDPASGWFAMTYFPPEQYPVWKTQLRDGRVDLDFAAQVGDALARIHAATADDADLARRFANDATFHAIRLEPYLEATATRHPDLADRLMALSRSTLARHGALVHGDISPKNILVGPAGPVFLDAECAWYGDPAFDLAFCLNHLLLKCLWNRAAAARYLAAFDALSAAYLAPMPAQRGAIEARAARLLPALFLARIDGKSPVEYITAEKDRDRVRRVAAPLIREPADRLESIRTSWALDLQRES